MISSVNHKSDAVHVMPRILHVDDEEDFLDIFRLTFGRFFNITCCSNSKDALSIMKENSFDAVITDYDMPLVNGIELLISIREYDPGIPVIFYTGQGNEAVAREAYIAGASGYFTKDFFGIAHKEKLIKSVKDAIEIRKSNQALLESEQKYRNLVENLNDVIYTLDTRGIITFVSSTVEHFAGYKPHELEGMNYLSLVHPDDRKSTEEEFQRILKGESVRIEVRFIVKDGSVIWVRSSNRPQIGSDGEIIGISGAVSNITEAKEKEKKITHLNQVLKAVLNIHKLIVEEKDEKILADKICECLTRTRGYRAAWMFLMDEKGGYGSSHEAGLGERFKPVEEMLKKGGRPACIRKVIESGKTLIIDDSEKCLDCPARGCMEFEPVITVPLNIYGRLLGTLTVFIPPQLVNEPEETGLLEGLAGDIAYALNNLEVEESHKKAQFTIFESEEKLSSILGKTPNPIMVLDENGFFVDVNSGAIKFLEMEKSEIINKKNIFDFIIQDQKEIFTKVDSGELLNREIDFRTGRRIKTMITSAVPLQSGDSRHIYFIGQDVSRQKEIINELKSSEDKLMHILESSGDVIIVFDRELKIVYFKCPDSYGISEEKALGLSHGDFFNGENARFMDSVVRDVFDTGKIQTYEVHDSFMGHEVYFAEKVFPLLDDMGLVDKVAKISHNITAYRQMENRQKEQMELLKTVVNNIPFLIHWKNKDNVIMGANDYFLRILNLKAEDVIGKAADKTPADPGLVDISRNMDNEVYQSGKPMLNREMSFTAKNGSIRTFLVSKIPLRGQNNEIAGILSVGADITGSVRPVADKTTLKAGGEGTCILRREPIRGPFDVRLLLDNKLSVEKRENGYIGNYPVSGDENVSGILNYRQLIEMIHEGIWIIDRDARTTYASPQLAGMFGYEVEEMLGKEIYFFMTAEYRSMALAIQDRCKKGVSENFEFVFKKKDGSELAAHLESTPVIDANGTFLGAVAGVIDITKLKSNERELKEKTIELGQKVRELDCLFNVSKVIEETDDDLMTLLDKTAGLMQNAMSMPAFYGIEIKAKDCISVTGPFDKEKIIILQDITVDGKGEGSIKISFNGSREAKDAFLPGEVKLAENIAIKLSNFIRRIKNRNELENIRNLLEEKVIEGTSDLEKAVKNLKDEIERRCTTEESLKDTNRMLDAIINASPSAILLLDRDGLVKLWNKAATEIFGYEKEEVMGKLNPLAAHGHKEDFMNGYKKVLEGETYKDKRAIRCRKDGTPIRVSIATAAVKDSSGQVLGGVGLITDITSHWQAQEELRRSEGRLRAIYEKSGIGIAVADFDGNYVQCNEAFCRMTGYTEEEIKNLTIRQITYPDDSDVDYENLDALRKGEISHYHREKRYWRKDGKYIWTDVSVSIIEGTHSERLALGIIQDITRRKAALEALKQSEEQYRAVVDAFDGYLYICSEENLIEFVNSNMFELRGTDIIGKKCHQVLHNLEHQCPWCAVDRVMTGQTVKTEILSPLDNRWYYAVNTPINNADGTVSKLTMLTDINDRKMMEIEMRKNQERMELASAAGNVFFWDVNLLTFEHYFDPRFKKALGYEDEEIDNNLEGGAWKFFVHPDDRNYVSSEMVKLINGEIDIVNLNHRALHRDGAVLWILVMGKSYKNEDGRVVRLAGTNIDVTKIHQMEEELRNRNRELTDFTHRVSHDLKSPINIIKGYLELIQEDPSLFEEYYKRVLRSADNMIDFIDSLLKLARAGKVIEVRDSVDLNDLISRVKDNLDTAGKTVSILSDGSLPLIMADSGGIEQVFDNIFQNSIKYSDPQKASVEIRVSHRLKENSLQIIISDNGQGIKPQYLSRVFDAGFTGNAKLGTGFGLAIARKIIEAHNGKIEATSEGPGKGTTFTLSFPVK